MFRVVVTNGTNVTYSNWLSDTIPQSQVVKDLRSIFPTALLRIDRKYNPPVLTEEQQNVINAKWLDGTAIFEQPTEPAGARVGDFWIVGD